MVKFTHELENNENLDRLSLPEKVKFIEQACTSIMSAPEDNYKRINSIMYFFKDQNFFICKLAMLSLAEVFKDTLPLYKIDKKESESRLKEVISKEERKLLNYEYSLSLLYERYLQSIYGIQEHLSKVIRNKCQRRTVKDNLIRVRGDAIDRIYWTIQKVALF